MSLSAGFIAEQQARDYLVKQGLKWVESNYRCQLGEIDLIMRDKEYLVFVEVRARTSKAYGGALESVGFRKQQKILKTASLYLLTRKIQEQYPIRFDIVSIEGNPSTLSWIPNAFTG